MEHPAERMKMDTPHIVPLAKQAIDVLMLLRQLSGQYELVFPGERKHTQRFFMQVNLAALATLADLQRPEEFLCSVDAA